MRIPYLSTLQTTKCLAIHLHPPPPQKKKKIIITLSTLLLWLVTIRWVSDSRLFSGIMVYIKIT